jgi:hypothetical protein
VLLQACIPGAQFTGRISTHGSQKAAMAGIRDDDALISAGGSTLKLDQHPRNGVVGLHATDLKSMKGKRLFEGDRACDKAIFGVVEDESEAFTSIVRPTDGDPRHDEGARTLLERVLLSSLNFHLHCRLF